MNTQTEEKKKYKKFRDYYADPEFKRKHLDYCMQQVECEACNRSYARSNMTKHIKSKKHQRNMAKLGKGDDNEDDESNNNAKVLEALKTLKEFLIKNNTEFIIK